MTDTFDGVEEYRRLFREGHDKTEDKRKMRELMAKYGETELDIENHATPVDYMNFLMAGGRDVLEMVQRENAQNQQPDYNPYSTNSNSEEIIEEEEEEEIEEDKINMDVFHSNITSTNKNPTSQNAERMVKNDTLHIRQTMGDQLSSANQYPKNTYQLGTLSAEHESRGNPAAIGDDNAGGYSYGKYQIASGVGTMNKYINYLQKITEYKHFAQKLNNAGGGKGAKAGTELFKNTWITLSKNPAFNQSQKQFIIETHLTPLLNSVKEKNILDINSRHPVIKDVLYSISVQHQGAAIIVNRAMNSLKQKYKTHIDDAELIKELYNQRTLYVKSLPESQKKGDGKITKREKENILKKRYPAEMLKALNFLK